MRLLYQLEEQLHLLLFIHFMRSMNGSFHPDSCPAHTCNGPTDVMMSSCRVDTITFPTILLSTTPTPIGCNLGFLSNGIGNL